MRKRGRCGKDSDAGGVTMRDQGMRFNCYTEYCPVIREWRKRYFRLALKKGLQSPQNLGNVSTDLPSTSSTHENRGAGNVSSGIRESLESKVG